MKKLLVLFILISTFTACSKEKSYEIVVTNYPLYFIVSSLVDSDVDVLLLTSNGDEHNYDLTTKQVIALNESIINFYIDLELETYMQNIEHSFPIYPQLNSQYTNYHFWMDPAYMITATNYISSVLIKNDFSVNNLDKLNASFQELVDEYLTITTQTQQFLVNHSSMYYLNTYGFSEFSLSDEHNHGEESTKDILAIIENNQIDFIVNEETEACQICAVVGDEMQLPVIKMYNLERSINALDYIEMQEYNISQLKTV